MTFQILPDIFNKSNGKSVPPVIESAGATEYRQQQGGTSFPKHLRWKLKTRDVEWMVITPEMAEEMLKYNSIEGFKNRPLSETTARRYAETMKAGKWGHKGQGTCEPIIFSDKGRILSAQHRLRGCVLAGVPFRALVVFGEPDENFAYIDQGRRRTAADVFDINGVPNALQTAATTRWILGYRADALSSHTGSSLTTTNEAAYAAYLQLPRLQDSIRISLRYAKDQLPSPSVAAGVHYICAEKARSSADAYFSKITQGIGFESTKDPAKKVRDMLTRGDGCLTPKEVACILIEGWNSTRANRQLRKVDFEKVGRVI